MSILTSKIDDYLNIKEQDESIRRRISLRVRNSELIEMYKKSENKDEFLGLLEEKERREIELFIEGGIL